MLPNTTYIHSRRHTFDEQAQYENRKHISNVQYTRTRRYLLIDSHAKCMRTAVHHHAENMNENSHWCWWFYHQAFSLCSLHSSEVLLCSPYLPYPMHSSVQQSNCKRHRSTHLQSKRLTYGQPDDAFNVCYRHSLPLLIIILIQKTTREAVTSASHLLIT